MTNFARPRLPDIHAILRKHCALIVHFSGTPKGGGSNFELAFPDDLRKVISGQSQSGLSCSVVLPNDEFSDLERANATGCIGLVLGLTSEQSLIDAHPYDCGTFMKNGSRQVPNARDMTAENIEDTVTSRKGDSYNEWVIANYSVIGIFAVAPFRFSADVPIDFPDDMPDYLRSSPIAAGFKFSSPKDLAKEFPSLPIYSFVGGVLVERVQCSWNTIPHSQLYA